MATGPIRESSKTPAVERVQLPYGYKFYFADETDQSESFDQLNLPLTNRLIFAATGWHIRDYAPRLYFHC